MNYCRFLATLLLAALAPADADELPNNPVFRRLIVEGINVSGDQTESLPSPTLADDADRAAQRHIVTRAAGKYGWSRFVRDSVVAPFAVELSFVKDGDGNRIGHSIDLWFVAYGTLEKLSDDRLINDLIQIEPARNAQDAQGNELSAKELAENGIVVGESDEFQEKFVYGEFPLMERVRVAGVGHAAYSRHEGSILMACELDERFAADSELGARWQPIRTDDLGRRKLGTARAYRGFGGYGKITELADPEGALFVECHIVFHEPEEWFTGSNFLRAKMPLLIQESVRKFRRHLRKEETAPDAPGSMDH